MGSRKVWPDLTSRSQSSECRQGRVENEKAQYRHESVERSSHLQAWPRSLRLLESSRSLESYHCQATLGSSRAEASSVRSPWLEVPTFA